MFELAVSELVVQSCEQDNDDGLTSKTKIVTNKNIFKDLDNLSFVGVFPRIFRSQTVSRIFWSENYKTHS